MEKDDKKKLRKRDKFWKVIFPHYKSHNKHKDSTAGLSNNLSFTPNNKDVPAERTPEQLDKITQLSNYAKNSLSISLDSEILGNLLESNDWDSKKSTLELVDYEEASHGILVEPPNKKGVALLGSENDGGTSCYIDALIFAMYISNTTFDPLLTYDIPSEDDDKVKLQTLLRLFVNKLRKGHFIKADYIHWLRKVLQETDWNGKNESGNWSQEDTSEFFLFITEIFDLPYLPFQIRLFHGANKDTDDDRVMTDRTLTLSIPDNDAIKEVKLQDILLDYFYSSVITGVKRQVDFSDDDVLENVAASPTVQTMMEQHDRESEQAERDEKYKLKQLLQLRQSKASKHNGQVAVTAWQVLELLPFYSATNEQGEAIQTQYDSSFPDTRMILPIVLKRYRFDQQTGGSSKMKKRVDIPVTIDFNKFVNQNVDDPMCPTCGHLVNWTLHFKSAVCHIGDSPYSGHYISYARILDGDDEEDEESYYWLKFDDMNTASRITQVASKDAASIYNDLAENAYIIFYELDKTCHHNARKSAEYSSLESSIDEDFKEDAKSTGSNSTHETDTEHVNCQCESSHKKKSKSKLKKKYHHHHHHHHHHLKESCKIM